MLRNSFDVTAGRQCHRRRQWGTTTSAHVYEAADVTQNCVVSRTPRR